VKGGEKLVTAVQAISNIQIAANTSKPQAAEGGQRGQDPFSIFMKIAGIEPKAQAAPESEEASSEEDPNALAAAALLALMNPAQTTVEAPAETDEAQIAPIQTTAQALTGEVASILESNKEINPTEAESILEGLQEGSARTPQGTTDELDLALKTESAPAAELLASVTESDSRPLENGSDKESLVKPAQVSDALTPVVRETETGAQPDFSQSNEESTGGFAKLTGELAGASGETEEKSGGLEEASGDVPELPTMNEVFDISAQRLTSSTRLEAPERSAPMPEATVESLFETMIESFQTMTEQDGQKATIQLKPDALGRISLELSSTDGGMHVKISADNAEVKGMIAGQIASLVETLSDKGSKVVNVEVVYTGVPGESLADSGSRGGFNRQPEGRRQSTATIAGEFETYSTLFYGDLGLAALETSQVEYSA
jgi:flagellar hook-length control protein FliK